MENIWIYTSKAFTLLMECVISIKFSSRILILNILYIKYINPSSCLRILMSVINFVHQMSALFMSTLFLCTKCLHFSCLFYFCAPNVLLYFYAPNVCTFCIYFIFVHQISALFVSTLFLCTKCLLLTWVVVVKQKVGRRPTIQRVEYNVNIMS